MRPVTLLTEFEDAIKMMTKLFRNDVDLNLYCQKMF